MINALAYPREITIASTPIKYSSSNNRLISQHELSGSSGSSKTSKPSPMSAFTCSPTHILVTGNVCAQANKKNYHVNHAYNFASSGEDSSSLGKETTHSSQQELVRKAVNGNGRGLVSVRRESFQRHIPQSMERQLAKNLQSIKIPSISMTVDQNGGGVKAAGLRRNNELRDSSQQSRYTDTDSTSVPSQFECSLRDEDAWLPILNIAEEQVNQSILD